VLCLFEGVATGAADGYARMVDKPAATLLHLGPGLGNGLANLHNTKRARSPVVNIVGDHATHHRAYDAPLTSDIEALTRAGVELGADGDRCIDAYSLAADGAAAIAAARTAPGQVATLILSADKAWNEGNGVNGVAPVPPIPPCCRPRNGGRRGAHPAKRRADSASPRRREPASGRLGACRPHRDEIRRATPCPNL
jgi:acetolactate synthase-1/2/3 large subunit